MRSLAVSASMASQVSALYYFTNICIEILELDLMPDDKFIVIASDGVWEFLSNDEIAKIVAPFFELRNAEKAADRPALPQQISTKILRPARGRLASARKAVRSHSGVG